MMVSLVMALLLVVGAHGLRIGSSSLPAALHKHRAPVVRLQEEEVLLKEPARNVIGTELQCCCADVHGSGIGTGFYRDGFCSTGPQDEGRHTVCIEATEAFLAYSAAVGNPLHQAIPEYMFPGVRP